MAQAEIGMVCGVGGAVEAARGCAGLDSSIWVWQKRAGWGKNMIHRKYQRVKLGSIQGHFIVHFLSCYETNANSYPILFSLLSQGLDKTLFDRLFDSSGFRRDALINLEAK